MGWPRGKERSWEQKIKLSHAVRGSKNPRSKLDPAAVKDIRDKLEAKKTPRELATEYGVHIHTIYDVRDCVCWTWVRT